MYTCFDDVRSHFWFSRVWEIGTCYSDGKKLGYSITYLDQVHWLPNWKIRSKPEAHSDIVKFLEGSTWLMEGNLFSSIDARIASADAVIFTDLSTWVCMLRVLWRIVCTYGRVLAVMAPEYREQFDPIFVKYILDSQKNGRTEISETVGNLPKYIMAFHIKKQRRPEAFFEGIPKCFL